MRDFRASYPDRECITGYVITDLGGVMRVQAFRTSDSAHGGTGEYVWAPEHGYSIPRSSLYATFEEAKTKAVVRAEESVRWANERLAKAKALTPEDVK